MQVMVKISDNNFKIHLPYRYPCPRTTQIPIAIWQTLPQKMGVQPIHILEFATSLSQLRLQLLNLNSPIEML